MFVFLKFSGFICSRGSAPLTFLLRLISRHNKLLRTVVSCFLLLSSTLYFCRSIVFLIVDVIHFFLSSLVFLIDLTRTQPSTNDRLTNATSQFDHRARIGCEHHFDYFRQCCYGILDISPLKLEIYLNCIIVQFISV